MEKSSDPQTRAESKTRLVEQIKACLKTGDYSRALELVRGQAVEFPNDTDLSELERLSQDGVKRKAEADRLITESQELFAQRKSTEAIQLLRKAYELDKHNSLARAILANALVEHAQSIVETDWLEAETLANQALALNPAHPTAKTIHSTVVDKKKSSSVEDWETQARKRQSSGDLFAALAWVAEGLAVHPDDPKLLQVQDAIQRDQGARRRQARRGDLEDLQRIDREIGGADAATKQALAERIQGIAAKHWTDGEILSVANALLLRLGLVPQKGSTASSQKKGGTVIFHVPRAGAPEEPRADSLQVLPAHAAPVTLPPSVAPPAVPAPKTDPVSSTSGSKDLAGVVVPEEKATKAPAPQNPPVQISTPKMATAVSGEVPVPAKKVVAASVQPKRPPKSSNTSIFILVALVAIVLISAIIFFARKHHDALAEKTSPPPVSAPIHSDSPISSPTSSEPAVTSPAPTPSDSGPAESTVPAASPTTEASGTKATPDQPTRDNKARADNASSDHAAADVKDTSANVGSMLIIVGQDNAKISLDGKLQRQLTRGGQARLLNLEPKEYVVQVSKNGFQDPALQKVLVRKGEEAKVVFNLQSQTSIAASLASLSVQGGAPGTTILIDQTAIGNVQADGTFSTSAVKPGDHTVELRGDRFKPRQFQKHFVAGAAVSLAGADTALEAALSEVKVTFTPSDARLAIAKPGDLPAMVSSGVPLNLAAGTYTLTARTAEGFTRSSALEVVAGQSKSFDLSLAPNGMSKWEDPAAWKKDKDSFSRSGGDFVLYGVVPTSGTFAFSAMVSRGHLLQWVLNYTDSKNYILFQMDENNFYRTVIRNGEKREQIIVPDKGERKSFRTLHVRVSATEIVHQIRHGNSWSVLDRWTQPGANLSLGKFGFYLPGNDQIELSGFAHYADLNVH